MDSATSCCHVPRASCKAACQEKALNQELHLAEMGQLARRDEKGGAGGGGDNPLQLSRSASQGEAQNRQHQLQLTVCFTVLLDGEAMLFNLNSFCFKYENRPEVAPVVFCVSVDVDS